MRVVAEGVDTNDQLAFLCGQACDLYQGYFFSSAVEPDALAGMLDASAADI